MAIGNIVESKDFDGKVFVEGRQKSVDKANAEVKDRAKK